MRAISTSVILILLGCHAFAGDAADAKKLQGAWEIVELSIDGKKVDFDGIKGTKFLFVGDRLTLQTSNKLQELTPRHYSFKINPKKNPAEIDLVVLDGKLNGIISHGIYEIKGDVFRWRHPDISQSPERPKDFTSTGKASTYLFTCKRVTK